MGCLSSKSSVKPEPPASEAARVSAARERLEKFKSELAEIRDCFTELKDKPNPHLTGACDILIIELIAMSKVKIAENPSLLDALKQERYHMSSLKESLMFSQCTEKRRDELEKHCDFINWMVYLEEWV